MTLSNVNAEFARIVTAAEAVGCASEAIASLSVADVGFGNLAPTAPFALVCDVEQDTPYEIMRFVRILFIKMNGLGPLFCILLHS